MPYQIENSAPRTNTATNTAANTNPPRIEVYHKTWCSYSRAALALLNEKGALYEDIDVTDDLDREIEMNERSGRTSVPQIFIGGELIGGFDDLKAFHALGGLDELPGPGAADHRKAA